MTHHEVHRSHRIGWLRASVLGANDGIVSTSSLIIGVAAANTAQGDIILAGLAGLVAGAMSMAAGEYVSVSSQSDTENADLELERKSLAAGEYVSVSSQSDTENADLELERKSLAENAEFEKEELAKIYQQRGLTAELASQVAEQLMLHDALGAHARDEIGITEGGKARPIQAALSSATTFTVGALLPLSVAWLVPLSHLIILVALFSLVFLTVMGGIAARAGGAPIAKASVRVTFWGALAMALTAGVGRLFGVVT